MFVLEVRTAEETGSIVTRGRFQTELVAVEAAVKDSRRWPGGWAYFDFHIDGRGPRRRRLPCPRRPPATPATPPTARSSRPSPSSIRRCSRWLRRRAARAIGAPPRAAAPRMAPSTCGPPSISTMRADSGLDAAEVLAERLPRDLRERAGQLHAGRPAADDDERQQPALRRRIRFALGRFERQQHPPPHLQRIVERLEPRRARRPTPDARSRRARRRPRGPDSRTGSGRRRSIEHALARGSIGAHLREQHLDVFLVAEDPADRRRDVARRQRCRRHLVQQRLEQVIVVAIEQRDAHVARRRARARRSSPPNPPPTMTTRGTASRVLGFPSSTVSVSCIPMATPGEPDRRPRRRSADRRRSSRPRARSIAPTRAASP